MALHSLERKLHRAEGERGSAPAEILSPRGGVAEAREGFLAAGRRASCSGPKQGTQREEVTPQPRQ